MAKSKKPQKPRDGYPKLPAEASPKEAPPSHAVRETVESIVIAFVLAFLFRTFEAEAFVIPTGSMAPTLMGRHKDVDCPKCGYRYQVSASEEEAEELHRVRSDVVAGMCPICHYVMPMTSDLRPGLAMPGSEIDYHRSYNGDRILVNKYIYTFSDPQRWDVVVFKFPGNAQINYIKRLVGLPGEKLRIYQGDLFVGSQDASQHADFKIAQKPADKVLAMRQLVHDTDYDPADLYEAGWPLRWKANGWQVNTEIDGINVRQRYAVNAGNDTAWLRYQHTVPTYANWQRLGQLEAQSSNGALGAFAGAESNAVVPRLITDANPYNARLDRHSLGVRDNLEIMDLRQGLHWVGDLMVEADVEIESAQGELLLDLVEGGQHFTCTVDLKTGAAKLGATGVADFAPKGKTGLIGPGTHRVAFANIDDQLLLWVDGDLIEFEGGTKYDVERVFGDRDSIVPRASDDDPGDFAPAGIGARGAKLAIDRLRVWRDIYYIAVNWQHRQGAEPIFDFYEVAASDLFALPYDPSLWSLFQQRRYEDFPLGKDQFFVMGDNSAESSDARLWRDTRMHDQGRPGGDYLERELLIGKALCVYWPHSWHRIPGTPIPFPLFPNFSDMRLVR